MFFHQIFLNIDNITNINYIKINEKIVDISFNPTFFMLLAVKAFELLPKHSRYGLTSGSFTLNKCIFATLANKRLLFPL